MPIVENKVFTDLAMLRGLIPMWLVAFAWGSRSINRTLRSNRYAKAAAKLTADVVFALPPLRMNHIHTRASRLNFTFLLLIGTSILGLYAYMRTRTRSQNTTSSSVHVNENTRASALTPLLSLCHNGAH